MTMTKFLFFAWVLHLPMPINRPLVKFDDAYNEKISCYGSLVGDLKQGYWKCKYKNGKVLREGAYLHGKRHGYWKFYHRNGQLAADGYYKIGEETGVWRIYDDRGNLLHVREEGLWGTGGPEITCSGSITGEQKEGLWICFYDNGNKLQEGGYFDGKRDGYWRIFHHNGVLAAEGTYQKGEEVGRWRIYDEAGKLILERND